MTYEYKGTLPIEEQREAITRLIEELAKKIGASVESLEFEESTEPVCYVVYEDEDDEDGTEVLSLVREVTRREDENKKQFLCRILDEGSQKAKILKCADRISNMISLGYVTDPEFIERYCDETEYFLLPMSIQVDFNMYQELITLIMTRRRYLEDGGYFDNRHKETTSADSTK